MTRLALYEWIIALLPVSLLALLAVLYARWPEAYLRIIVEDGPAEWLQAAFWFLSSAAGLIAARRLRLAARRKLAWLMVLFMVATFFVGAEEISWGQRMVGWRTPAQLDAINLQGETTLHNIRGGQRLVALFMIAAGLFGAFAWRFRDGTRSRPGDVRNFILPDWPCALYFLPAALFYLTIDHPGIANRLYARHPAIVSSQHQEVVELFLAMGVLIFALDNARQAARLAHSPFHIRS
jgi:hypothetical protein